MEDSWHLPSPASARIRAAAIAAVRAWQCAEAFDAALLYGSAAWGDADEGSDGDVMLLHKGAGVWDEVTRVRDDASGLHFDVVRASWNAFERGVAGGWWLPRLACGLVLLDTGQRLALAAAPARRAWRDPVRRRERAVTALGSAPECGTGPGLVDAWRQAAISAAHAVLLARGVPPSGHHLLSRLHAAAGRSAVEALVEGLALPRSADEAMARHAAAMELLAWARGLVAGLPLAGQEPSQLQLIRFALSEDAHAAAVDAAAGWRRQRAWAQWGLVSRDLARIAVLRNVAPVVGVPPEPAAFAAWLGAHAPSLVTTWWEALGLRAGAEGDRLAAQRAHSTLAALINKV